MLPAHSESILILSRAEQEAGLSLFSELRRRNVFRVAAAYAVIAWLLVQIVVSVLPVFETPLWVLQLFIVLLVLGFPVALVLAWVYELTSQGIQATADVAPPASMLRLPGRKLDFAIIGLLVLGLSFVVVERYFRDGPRDDNGAMQSIAVLAFANLSGDPQQDYFGDGISEELLNILARVRNLRVSSRTSAFSFKNKGIGIPIIAAELNVDHVLEGSVRKQGDRVRITAQLIDVATDSHLWSETYERDLADIFAVQDEIALRVAESLTVQLLGANANPLRARRTDNLDAYDAYLRGLDAHRKGLPVSNFLEAIGHYRRAIALDPQFVQARARLAAAYIGLGNFRAMLPQDAYEQAEIEVERTLDLDEDLGEAHASLGWLRLSYHWDWPGAEQSFRRAIELEPNSSTAYEGLHYVLAAQGKLTEALTAAETSYELDPLSVFSRDGMVAIYLMLHDYDSALHWSESTVQLNPSNALEVAWLGIDHALRGEAAVIALDYAEQATRLEPQDPHIALAVALIHAHLGDVEAVQRILDQVEPKRTTEYVSAGFLAVVYASLGEADLAFEWLDRAYDEHDSWLFNLGYPELDPIRDDPRFEALLLRLDLPVVLATSVQPATPTP